MIAYPVAGLYPIYVRMILTSINMYVEKGSASDSSPDDITSIILH